MLEGIKKGLGLVFGIFGGFWIVGLIGELYDKLKGKFKTKEEQECLDWVKENNPELYERCEKSHNE